MQNNIIIENVFQDLDLKQSLESPDFKNITKLAKSVFDVPIALITIIDDENLYVSESKNFTPVSVPLENTFCSYARKQNSVFIVEDATKDERFVNNKYVIEEGFRFYAGTPIKVSNEINVGNFCLMGFEPKILTEKECEMLRDFANQCASLFKLHFIALKQKQQAIKLKESVRLNQKAQIMINNMHDGLTIQNIDGDIEFVNPSACRILGYSKEQLLQKSSKDDWAAIDENGNKISWLEHPTMRALHGNKNIENAVIAVNRPNGERAWLQISAIPLINEIDGKAEKVLATFADITKIKLQEQELRSLSKKAESANIAKSAFLANMSHEIRTPLNGVLGIASALQNTKLDDNQREMVGIINESGLSLASLLNDIIDLSKIESGNFALEYSDVSPSSIIKQSISLFVQSAKQKNIDINFVDELPDELILRLDNNRIKQIINNLIGNAVKFTNSGAVTIGAKFVKNTNEEDGKLHIEIKDTGIGFDEDTKARLFGRFVQADEGISRKFGGSGLGLSICKALINNMNGMIDCKSTPDIGSVFWFEINAKIVKKIAEISKSQNILKAQNNFQKILIVEDNLINQKVLKMLLGDQNLELEFAQNGQKAVELFQSDKFDLILMDTQMPIMDGLEATKIIRKIESDSKISRTPIINLSANVMHEQIMESMQAGADDYIAKPIAANELFEKIDHWLNVA